jgi:anti-anti-sigma factor
MEIETVDKNGCTILRVKEDLSAKSDLTTLKSAIKKHLSQGQYNLALAFTADSYFHTQTVSILVQCIEMVHKRGGMLGIVNPNSEILDMLNTISLDRLVNIYPSEDAVASKTAADPT